MKNEQMIINLSLSLVKGALFHQKDQHELHYILPNYLVKYCHFKH